jgi:hypothetical protein
MRPTAAVEAVAPTGSKDSFAPQRESGTARTERRNLPAVIAAPRMEGTAMRPASVSLPYLAQHIAQEILGLSLMPLDLRFHDHPGFDADAAMQAAEPALPVQRPAWA